MNSLAALKRFGRLKWFFVLLGILFLIPYYSTDVPEWKIISVKPDGKAPASVAIRQEWSSYAIVPISTDIRTTDHTGLVTFPERRFFCPLLGRMILRTMDILNSLTPHGGRVG